jgi:hypothetical protein
MQERKESGWCTSANLVESEGLSSFLSSATPTAALYSDQEISPPESKISFLGSHMMA